MNLKKKDLAYFLVFFLLISTFIPLIFSRVVDSGQNTKFPETVAGKKAQIFFDSLIKADSRALEQFFEGNIPHEKLKEIPARERAQRILNLRKELGELSLKKVDSPSPDEIVAFLSPRQNELLKFRLVFEARGGNHYLKEMGVDEADQEELASPLPPLTQSEALQAIDQKINQAVSEDKFSGVVLIAKNLEPIFFKAWGLASKEFSVPNRTDTKFNLGSINKIFTKISVGQLVEKGLLSLDENLGKFLPDYPNADAREKVTVRHLVEMKSGIGDFFGPKFQNTPKNFIRHNRDYLSLFADQPLAFEPGTRQAYSNGGYVVLGEIITMASGMDYYYYVRKNIFEPAGMTRTDSYQADLPVANLAEGYTKQMPLADKEEAKEKQKEAKNHWRKNIYTRPARGSAAGGGYSTAEDLLRFVRSLSDNKLLSPAYMEWVFSGQEPGAEDLKKPSGGQKKGSLGIAGGAPGINATVDINGETGFTIIVLSNYDPPVANQISKMIRRHLSAIQK